MRQSEHWYTINERKTNHCVFVNKNFSCFAEYDSRPGLFKPEYDLKFYWWNIDEDLNKVSNKALLEFRKIGIPIKSKIITKTKTDWGEEPTEFKCVEFTLNFKQCKSREMSVLALHLCRFLWDWSGPKFLVELYDYKEKYKSTFWEAFIIVKKYSINSPSHDYMECWVKTWNIPTIKFLKNIIKKFKKGEVKKNANQFAWIEVFYEFFIKNPNDMRKANEFANISPKEYRLKIK